MLARRAIAADRPAPAADPSLCAAAPGSAGRWAFRAPRLARSQISFPLPLANATALATGKCAGLLRYRCFKLQQPSIRKLSAVPGSLANEALHRPWPEARAHLCANSGQAQRGARHAP